MGLLRSLFGPSKDEMWRKLCAEIDADFVEGGFLRDSKVQLHEDDWIITLDTYTQGDGKNNQTYTRMRAPFVNPDGFAFTICRTGFFREIGKQLFGTEDIEVGHPLFDRDFILKSNSPGDLRALCSNERIRELIQIQPHIHLTVKDDEGWFGASFPDGVDELVFHVSGVIKDTVRLQWLFDLFSEVLRHICHLGAAYQDDVDLLIEDLLGPGGTIEKEIVLWKGDPPRHRAADALASLKEAKAVHPLISVLDDQDPVLREKAFFALAEIGDAAAVPGLIPWLGHTEGLSPGATAQHAARALCALGQADFVDAFATAMAGDTDRLKPYLKQYPRAQIIMALVNVIQGPGLPALKAARVLADLGATEALPAIRAKAKSFGSQHETRARLMDVVAELEARASLPRSAQAQGPDAGLLPRPAEEPGADTGTLPRALDDEPHGDD